MAKLPSLIASIAQSVSDSIKRHVYTANSQWKAHKMNAENLQLDTIITIEDYQQNIEIVHTENPTAMVYSSNKKSFAIYPVAIINLIAVPFFGPMFINIYYYYLMNHR